LSMQDESKKEKITIFVEVEVEEREKENEKGLTPEEGEEETVQGTERIGEPTLMVAL